MADLNNKLRGVAVREIAARVMRSQGLDDVVAKPMAPTVSAALREYETTSRSDLLGVRGWHIATHADISARWGSRLAQAEHEAGLDGAKHFAVVEYRRDVDPADWFALMTLGQLGEIIATLARHPDGHEFAAQSRQGVTPADSERAIS